MIKLTQRLFVVGLGMVLIGCAGPMEFANRRELGDVHNQSYSGSVMMSGIKDNSEVVVSQDARIGTLKGETDYHTVLGLISWGDQGTAQAAQKAGIKQVTSVEKTGYQCFPFYKRVSTIVTGEPSVTPSSVAPPTQISLSGTSLNAQPQSPQQRPNFRPTSENEPAPLPPLKPENPAIFYVAKNNQQLGPMTVDDLKQKLNDGVLWNTDLGWKPGMEKWEPLRAMMDKGLIPR